MFFVFLSYPNSKSIPSSFPMFTANAQAATITNIVPPIRNNFVVESDSADDADEESSWIVDFVSLPMVDNVDDDNCGDGDWSTLPPSLPHTSSTSWLKLYLFDLALPVAGVILLWLWLEDSLMLILLSILLVSGLVVVAFLVEDNIIALGKMPPTESDDNSICRHGLSTWWR